MRIDLNIMLEILSIDDNVYRNKWEAQCQLLNDEVAYSVIHWRRFVFNITERRTGIMPNRAFWGIIVR